MTDEELTFLDLIGNQPDDDTARLVYADWLEENDHVARADAIRRGVKKPKRFTFAEGKPAVVAYTGTRSDTPRVVEVVAAHGWPGVKWTTYKGLLESATLTWAAWLAQDAELLLCFRLPEVVLTTVPDVTRVPNPSSVDGFREFVVPGRPKRHKVLHGENPIEVVLRGEWPGVKRWVYPQTVLGKLDFRTGTGSGLRFQPAPPATANVGDIVRLADDTTGVLMAPVGEDGRALVRPSRG